MATKKFCDASHNCWCLISLSKTFTMQLLWIENHTTKPFYPPLIQTGAYLISFDSEDGGLKYKSKFTTEPRLRPIFLYEWRGGGMPKTWRTQRRKLFWTLTARTDDRFYTPSSFWHAGRMPFQEVTPHWTPEIISNPPDVTSSLFITSEDCLKS